MIRLAPLFLLACSGGGTFDIKLDIDTGVDGSDTDTDTDTDADADIDTDIDTDTDVVDTGDTDPVAVIPPPDWVVDCNGGGDFSTIQDAIDGAMSGDRIGLEPCTYNERIELIGKTLEIYGIDGSATTIIDGGGAGSVVKVEEAEGLGTRIAGVTIRGGADDDDGSAIEVHEAHLELDDVLMTDNGESFAVLYLNIAWVDLNNVQIYGNDVMDDGYAIWSDSGSLTIDESLINCDGGTYGIWHHNALILNDSFVTCPGGYGMEDYHGEDNIHRSTLIGGIAGVYAHDTESTDEEPDSPTERITIVNTRLEGGDFGADVRYMTGLFTNTIFEGGTAGLVLLENDPSTTGAGNVFVNSGCGVDSDLQFDSEYSSFWNNGTDGCGLVGAPTVTADPLFVSYPIDVTLQPGSPLIDAGPPQAWLNDVDGTRNDIGIHGGGLPHQ